MPEQIKGNTQLGALKEHLTQESFGLRGSEKQRYLFFPCSGFKELKQLVPGVAANIVQRKTWCFSTTFLTACVKNRFQLLTYFHSCRSGSTLAIQEHKTARRKTAALPSR